jgi:hypothetical protein
MKTLSISEAARVKGCTRGAILHAITKGRLPFEEVMSTTKRVRVADLKKLVINPKRQASGELNGKKRKLNGHQLR